MTYFVHQILYILSLNDDTLHDHCEPIPFCEDFYFYKNDHKYNPWRHIENYTMVVEDPVAMDACTDCLTQMKHALHTLCKAIN